MPLEELHAFQDYPYKVMDDACMVQMIESVGTHGVLVPIVVRPIIGGGYELISGHRRKRACELAGIDTIPAIVRDVDDDTAIIMMVDSNVRREGIFKIANMQMPVYFRVEHLSVSATPVLSIAFPKTSMIYLH